KGVSKYFMEQLSRTVELCRPLLSALYLILFSSFISCNKISARNLDVKLPSRLLGFSIIRICFVGRSFRNVIIESIDT
ncbi:hypothetical protein L9F63_028220, partial [Diploptera punctata]